MARLPLIAYGLACLALAAWLVTGAVDRAVPVVWIAIWLGELALMAAAPRWPLAGVAAWLAMAYGVSSHGSLHDTLLVMGVLDGMAALLLAAWLLWRRSAASQGLPWVRVPPVAWALFTWVAACVAVATWHGLPIGPFPRHHPSAFFQAAVLLAVTADSLRTRQQVVLGSVLVAAIVLTRAVLQAPDGIHLESYLATLAVVGAPLVLLGAMLSTGWLQRTAFALAAAALAAVVVMGENRAAAVAAAAAVLAALAQAIWRPQHRRAAVAMAAVTLVAAVTWLTASDYGARFRSLWNAQAHAGSGLDRGTASERLTLWRAGWQMAQHEPVFGVGPGNYQALLRIYQSGIDPLSAHSNYVQMLAETGFPGLLLYLAFFGGTLLALGAAASRSSPGQWTGPAARLMQVSLVAYLAGGAFNSRHDFVLAYALAGAALAVVAASRKGTMSTRPGAPA